MFDSFDQAFLFCFVFCFLIFCFCFAFQICAFIVRVWTRHEKCDQSSWENKKAVRSYPQIIVKPPNVSVKVENPSGSNLLSPSQLEDYLETFTLSHYVWNLYDKNRVNSLLSGDTIQYHNEVICNKYFNTQILRDGLSDRSFDVDNGNARKCIKLIIH